MAKSKYGTHVKPRLSEILSWARRGMIDEEIAKCLGIAYSTFRAYKDKHKELAEVLRNSKSYADSQVESALYKRALGYEYDEVKSEYESDKLVKKTITKKMVVPDTTAQMFWLKNRMPKDYQEKLTANIEGEIAVNIKLEELL